MDKYLIRRAQLKTIIKSVIYSQFPKLELRGSWEHDDFHLDYYETKTLSDIDLVSHFKPGEDLCKIKFDLKSSLDRIIKMKISIHPNDFLSSISAKDSKNKNIFEYLIFHRHNRNNPEVLPYMQAKIMLWLLTRKEGLARFKEISEELNHESAYNLYKIKTGEHRDINIGKLENLIGINGDEIAHSFFENCIIKEPSEEYFSQIQFNFFSSKSIHDWLKARISQKLERNEN
jgi:predicted nucleotidyltransferase